MDIQIEQKSPTALKKYWYVPVGVIALVMVWWLKSLFGGASYVVDTKTLRTASVKKDDFSVSVRSNGELRPKQYQWISAEVNGQVAQVLINAGDSVEVGQPLIELRNPQLLTQMEKAEWEFKQIESESFANQKIRESQLLQLQSESLTTELAYKGNMLKLKAEKHLISKGQGQVSEIDHQRTIFSVEEQKKIWDFYKKRIGKKQESIAAQKQADDARIGKLQNELTHAKRQVELLIVRSLSQGIVQEMSLEMGQKLNIGTTVARIADDSQLIAELKVQELQVQRVQLGQAVIVDTRKNKLRGKVMRIHPSVINGMVQVDVDLIDPLPPEARIALSVEGSITTYAFGDTLFVQRPAYVQPNATVGIFRVNVDGTHAERIPVKLGESSVKFVQVLGGLKEGDMIIVSDTSSYSEHQTILLN
ncbi:MAG: HlyD family efflux transporter periplasmic adaptor subunit [Algicola sp.]|nr:HlyD family efflux transporter periplasmic adaptor subunit [Algicola sp.]